MNRDQLEELLSRDLDGDLTPSEQVHLRAAEAADPTLADLRRAWQRVGQSLHDLPAPGAPNPAVAWQDVRRAIRLAGPREAAPAPRPGFGWRLAWSGGALSLALVLFVLAGRWWPAAAPAGLARAALRDVEVEYVESDLPGGSPMVYQDEESGWTIVWVAAAEPAQPPAQDS